MTPAERLNPMAGSAAPVRPWLAGWISVAGTRDAVVIALLTMAAAASLFSLARPDSPWQDASYLLVVPLCWTTVRASPRLAAVVFLVVALMATGATIFSIGPFGVASSAW